MAYCYFIVQRQCRCKETQYFKNNEMPNLTVTIQEWQSISWNSCSTEPYQSGHHFIKLSLSVNIKSVNIDVPGKSCCPLIPMGGIPRLFMAVAQAFGSDMGIVMELESIVMLQIPSARQRVTQTRAAIISVTFKSDWSKVPAAGGDACNRVDWDRRLFSKGRRAITSCRLHSPNCCSNFVFGAWGDGREAAVTLRSPKMPPSSRHRF